MPNGSESIPSEVSHEVMVYIMGADHSFMLPRKPTTTRQLFVEVQRRYPELADYDPKFEAAIYWNGAQLEVEWWSDDHEGKPHASAWVRFNKNGEWL